MKVTYISNHLSTCLLVEETRQDVSSDLQDTNDGQRKMRFHRRSSVSTSLQCYSKSGGRSRMNKYLGCTTFPIWVNSSNTPTLRILAWMIIRTNYFWRRMNEGIVHLDRFSMRANEWNVQNPSPLRPMRELFEYSDIQTIRAICRLYSIPS